MESARDSRQQDDEQHAADLESDQRGQREIGHRDYAADSGPHEWEPAHRAAHGAGRQLVADRQRHAREELDGGHEAGHARSANGAASRTASCAVSQMAPYTSPVSP